MRSQGVVIHTVHTARVCFELKDRVGPDALDDGVTVADDDSPAEIVGSRLKCDHPSLIHCLLHNIRIVLSSSTTLKQKHGGQRRGSRDQGREASYRMRHSV
jgi:hypothetical protein